MGWKGKINMQKNSGKILQLNSLLNKKEVSCTELTKKYLNKIEEENTNLNAYVKVTKELALDTAKIVDEKISSGEKVSPLEGIPMNLKDNVYTQGIETTACSKILKGYKPSYDATLWSILKEKNAVLLGKTNMDEFAMGCSCETSCFGGSNNPLDVTRVPGGSSGGTAASVAGDLAVYGIGSDTGGSIRQPASFCGIVGLRPTYGAISRYGLIDLAASVDQAGPMGTCVEDVALVYDAISKKDINDSTSLGNVNGSTFEGLRKDIKGVKIGLPKQYFENLNDDIKGCMAQVIKTYENLGAELVEIDIPSIKYALPIYYVLVCAEASRHLAETDGIKLGNKAKEYKDIEDLIVRSRSEGFGDEVKRRILIGTYVLSSGQYERYYNEAQKIRQNILKTFKETFNKFDILLGPTVPQTAFEHGFKPKDQMEAYLTDICTAPASLAGIPAVSIPCGVDSKGLPIGVHLIADSFKEKILLNTAYKFEEANKSL